MKIPLPMINHPVNLKHDWKRISSLLDDHKTKDIFIMNRREVTGIVTCKPTPDELDLATSTDHYSGMTQRGVLHCYQHKPDRFRLDQAFRKVFDQRE